MENPSLEAVLHRLAMAGIQLLPVDIPRHFLLEREGFVALVERTGQGFGRIGSAGLLSQKGLAPLVWRGAEAWFVAKGFEQRATAEQVAGLRGFAEELESCLAGVSAPLE